MNCKAVADAAKCKHRDSGAVYGGGGQEDHQEAGPTSGQLTTVTSQLPISGTPTNQSSPKVAGKSKASNLKS